MVTVKTMKTSFGDMDIDIPRDRNGDFEPKAYSKHQTTLSGDIEEKSYQCTPKE